LVAKRPIVVLGPQNRHVEAREQLRRDDYDLQRIGWVPETLEEFLFAAALTAQGRVLGLTCFGPSQ
jgi:hypothetical protein